MCVFLGGGGGVTVMLMQVGGSSFMKFWMNTTCNLCYYVSSVKHCYLPSFFLFLDLEQCLAN